LAGAAASAQDDRDAVRGRRWRVEQQRVTNGAQEGSVKRTTAVLVTIATLLVAAPAHAQVERPCRSVTAGKWKATSVSAFNMGCTSARNKLRRWLRRDRLPRDRNGWHCYRSGVPGKNRQCITFSTQTGDPVGFDFLLRRRTFG